ncbi:hypothetical protein P3534_23185, partial [Vibrio parahaemolyticus]|nr:hypothetical protein [Vibrio parahaemolyticus]
IARYGEIKEDALASKKIVTREGENEYLEIEVLLLANSPTVCLKIRKQQENHRYTTIVQPKLTRGFEFSYNNKNSSACRLN